MIIVSQIFRKNIELITTVLVFKKLITKARKINIDTLAKNTYSYLYVVINFNVNNPVTFLKEFGHNSDIKPLDFNDFLLTILRYDKSLTRQE